jgi:hypothetical protein
MRKILLITLMLMSLLLLSSCGGGGSSTPTGSTPDTTVNTSVGIATFLPNNLLGFVSDPDGTLIPFATLGGASTGSTGITTEAVTATAAGWYAVEAAGYATGYTKSVGQLNGIAVISATLTPVDTEAFHAVGDTTVITVGPADAPVLTVTLGLSVFAEDAIIEVTALDPGLLDTTYAPMDASGPLYINQPFEIRARSAADGSLLQPVSGEVVDVTLTDGGALGDPPRLFWFDPEQGMWIEQSGADTCSRVDVDHVSCQLTHFSQHAGGGSAPPPPSGNGSDHDQASANTDKEHKEAADDVAERQRNGEETGACDILTPGLVDAFKAEVEAALAEANKHPSEAAKRMLMKTAARLEWAAGVSEEGSLDCPVGDPANWAHAPYPNEVLRQAIEDVTKKLAADLLAKPAKCPDIDAVNKVLGEAWMLGFRDLDPIPTLENKYNELLDQCNVWEGQIEYSILLPRALASFDGHDYNPWYSGARDWAEYHDIQLVLHASSATSEEEVGNFDGTDMVTTDFQQVEYRAYVLGTGCSFPVYEADSRRGQPANGGVDATFAGSVDPSNGFIADSFTAANKVDIEWGYFETGWTYEGDINSLVCVKRADGETGASDPYRGQLVEQFAFEQYMSGQSDDMGNDQFGNFTGDEFPSLWDILNAGPTQPAPPASETNPYPKAYYTGTEMLFEAYSFGLSNDMRIVMRWNLVHTDYTRGR